MKNVLCVILLLVAPVLLVTGCGLGESGNDTPTDRVPPETKGAELMDSTRLDPAPPDTLASETATALPPSGK